MEALKRSLEGSGPVKGKSTRGGKKLRRGAGAKRAMLKIVRRLNPDDPDPCNDVPEKPKGMHWSTYDRLVERYEAYSDQWGLEIMRRFGRRFR